MKRTATPTFVLTIPLVVKPDDDRALISRMEAGRRLYNATLDEALRRYGLLKQSKAWQATRDVKDKKARSAEFQRLSKEAGFTPAATITFARACKNEAGWKDRLGSNVTQRIAEQVFAAMQQYAFGNSTTKTLVDAQNMGHNRPHAVGFPIRQSRSLPTGLS